jgi:hypothetical protein
MQGLQQRIKLSHQDSIAWGISSLLALSHVTFNAGNVHVDVFVKSKSLDTQKCLTTFAQGFASVSAIINLSLNYIATEPSPGQFVCLNGDTECSGNRQQLCARNISTSPVVLGQNPDWVQFALCQTTDRFNIPWNGASCAQATGVDVTQLAQCVTTDSQVLFERSIAKSNGGSDTYGCTIKLNGDAWCQVSAFGKRFSV